MQKKQFGRSMIEMLGVLAIIGVLSIGGLLGYRRAVNNHQANTILDDANRLAFVIMENDRAYETNDFVDEELIDSVTYTGTYNLDAFMAQAGQFGIVVTKVPKGVCESLVPKAAVEYKVRVMPWSEEKYLVPQMSNIGTIYDSFHKDICGDENDVVLYFNDTSAQCNKPDEGETYAKCLSNADCCGGYFCIFFHGTPTDAGLGQCRLISYYIYEGGPKIMPNGKVLIQSRYCMDWWSTQNWCAAQGLSVASRSDIDCESDSNPPYSCTSSAQAAVEEWGATYRWHWLEDSGNGYSAYALVNSEGIRPANRGSGNIYALCH